MGFWSRLLFLLAFMFAGGILTMIYGPVVFTGAPVVCLAVAWAIGERSVWKWRLAVVLSALLFLLYAAGLAMLRSNAGHAPGHPWTLLSWVTLGLSVLALVVLALDRPSKWLAAAAADRD